VASKVGSGSQSALREANAARIVDAVRRFGSLTQVELAETTNLSPATVSTIVKSLLESGAIETRATVRSGRRAQLVTLARQSGILVGVHVGRRNVRMLVSDASFTVLGEQNLPLRPDHLHDTTLDRVALLIVEQVEALGSSLDEVLGIGVGIPAPLDPATGMIAARGLMRGWEDVNLSSVLAARLGRPVVVNNDAKMGLLGEARFGAARGFADVMYVRSSYGTGAGILIGGDLHHGPHGTAGEIGHMLVDPLGPICRCGSRGCLDTVVGATALIDSLRTSHGPLTLGDVLRLASEGDPGCRQVVTDAGALIGTQIANLAVAFDPAVVVVGGELATTEDLLLDPIRAALERRILLQQGAGLPVIVGQLGDDAEAKGALAAASEIAVSMGGIR